MWRDRRQPYAEHPATDAVWLTIGAVLLAAGLLAWTVGQVAAVLFGGHHPLPMPAEDMAGVLWNLPGHVDDPAQAWPPTVRGMLPGPVGMYAALVLTVWGPVLLVGLLIRRFHPHRRRERKAKGASWASLWQLRRLLVPGPRRGRIILGRRDRWRDLLVGKVLLAVEQCHSVLCFGPPGSYKTHALVIPAILEWQGPLVATSIKPDVLRATLTHRATLGEVWVYDPLSLSGVAGSQWTALAYCQTYAKAKRIGRMLADAADVQGHKQDDATYWQLLGAKLLACVLYAAAGTGRTMADVARWVDVQDFDEVATCLGELGDQQALDAWAACISRPDNTRGSVFGTAETLLDVFGDPVVAESAEGCDLDLEALLTGPNKQPVPIRPRLRAGAAAPVVRAPGLGGDQQGGGAGRRPARRDAQPEAVRVPGRGRQLRRHQEAAPAGDDGAGPRHPAPDRVA
jgi:type IV secretion system protein VirD4